VEANPLVGAWRLVSCETRSRDGAIDHPLGRDAVGLLIYTADGHMAVSIARSNRRPFADGDLLGGTGAEKASAVDSYISYCGRYERREGSVVHQVGMSLFPNWTGRDQERLVELEGDRLTLEAPPFSIKGVEQRSVLVWERL
jgi:Lipocalin-like domain